MTKDQFQGRTSVDPRWNTIHEDGSDWPSTEHPVNYVFQTGKPVMGFLMGVFNPQTNKYRWLLCNCIPRFRDGEEKPYQVCSVMSDVTHEQEVKNRLLHAKEKAEEADKLKSAFLATMSHELRTLLNGVIGHLDLILSNELDESHREENLEGLWVAKQSSNLLISIIEDILDLSKIEAGQLDITRKPFSIDAVVEQTMQIANAYRIQKKRSHVDLRREVATLPANYIYGDEIRLQQILNNLMSNAIKFTREGFVSLSVCCLHGNLQFCIHDSGKGIPEEKLEVIFDPFRQVELSDTREHGGTGLGLTICKKLVDLMGGKIRVESSVSGQDRGSKFYVSIPFDQVSEQELQNLLHKRRPKVLHPRKNSISSTSSICRKILVAEDDPVSRRIILKMLEKAGQETLVAKDGLQAVQKFCEHRHEIALTFMDVMMPNLDGLEASKRIREIEAEEPTSRQVPIIALSAGAMKGDREKGIEYGMTDYLTKPIGYKVLVATLENYLGI